jgi:hypothetical protein
MASQWELSARVALCRQLAKREPRNGIFWMAEAENWRRLSKEKFRGEQREGGVAGLALNVSAPLRRPYVPSSLITTVSASS